MNVQMIDTTLPSLDALADCEAICLLLPADERPLSGAAGYVDWRLCGQLSRTLLDEFFSAEKNEHLLMTTSGTLPVDKIFVAGVGSAKTLDATTLGAVLYGAAIMLKKAGVTKVALGLPSPVPLPAQAQAAAVKSQFMPSWLGTHLIILGDKASADTWKALA